MRRIISPQVRGAMIGIPALLVVALAISAFFFFTSPQFRLGQVGYSDDEKSAIFDALGKDDLSRLYDLPHIEKLDDIIKRDGYDNTLISRYIDYHLKYGAAELDRIVSRDGRGRN